METIKHSHFLRNVLEILESSPPVQLNLCFTLSGWIRSPVWCQMSLTCSGTWPSWMYGITGLQSSMPASSPSWKCSTARGTASSASRPRVPFWKASTPPATVGLCTWGTCVVRKDRLSLLSLSLPHWFLPNLISWNSISSLIFLYTQF